MSPTNPTQFVAPWASATTELAESKANVTWVNDLDARARTLADRKLDVPVFEAERQRWRDDKIDEVDIYLDSGPTAAAGDVPEGHVAIYCEAPGSVWKVLAKEGSQIQAGDTLMIVESMKMEIAIQSTSSGIVRKVSVRAGQIVNAGDQVCILQES